MIKGYNSSVLRWDLVCKLYFLIYGSTTLTLNRKEKNVCMYAFMSVHVCVLLWFTFIHMYVSPTKYHVIDLIFCTGLHNMFCTPV